MQPFIRKEIHCSYWNCFSALTDSTCMWLHSSRHINNITVNTKTICNYYNYDCFLQEEFFGFDISRSIFTWPEVRLWCSPALFETITQYFRYIYKISHILDLLNVKDKENHPKYTWDRTICPFSFRRSPALAKDCPAEIMDSVKAIKTPFIHFRLSKTRFISGFFWLDVFHIWRSAWSHLSWDLAKQGFHIIP